MAHGEFIQQQPVDITTSVEKSGQDTSRKAEIELESVLAQPALARDRSGQDRARRDERPTELDT
eukprot:563943-Amphidinium_carterae.1